MTVKYEAIPRHATCDGIKSISHPSPSSAFSTPRLAILSRYTLTYLTKLRN